MANVSDSAVNYEDMATTDILKEMKKMMVVLEKKTKKAETALSKMEEKKEKSAPVKGVRPTQLAQNAEWVQFVHEHILAEGWESFIHPERSGKGMVDVEYPGSEVAEVKMEGETVQIHIFSGSDNEQPNLSHAMSLSKQYRTTKPELYEEFLSQYVAEVKMPVEGVAKSSVRVTMTLAERQAEKARKEAEKEAEKAQKKAEREAERERKKAEKEEEKRLKAEAKAAAKKAPPKAVVVRKIVPVAAKVVKRVSEWVPPAKGESKLWTEPKSGVTYLRDHLDRLFILDGDEEDDTCVGWWNGKCIIDDENQIPMDEDE